MRIKTIFLLCTVIWTVACTGLPKGISPVPDFAVERYLGTWYEIARLDHRFERGLSDVSAEYSLQEDGQIRVVNRGFNQEKNEFSEAIGRAKFVEDERQGYLKVSFFGPFYGSYVIFDLDENYQRAYVAGNNRSYLWFLSRTPTVSEEHMSDFRARAAEFGFPLEELITVDQSKNL